jgi:pyruvate dehydrogenase E2 component (dihydrolipoamide acetyltransferase)
MSADQEKADHQIVMPRLHGNGTYSKVVAWLKEEGDPIQRGDSLLTMETDKATIDLAAEQSGVLARILQPAGVWVKIPAVVGTIRAVESTH